MNPELQSTIPQGLDKSFSQRDQSTMEDDDFIKFQMISLMPGIAKNFRFLIKNDGQLFYAENTSEQPEDRSQIFNTQLPEEPDRQLAAKTMSDIQEKIEEVDFFAEPAYQTSKAKDGSLTIVTIRREGQMHEVWYENIHNSLTDLLHSISPTEPVEKTVGEHLSSLTDIITELKELQEKSNKHLDDENENSME